MTETYAIKLETLQLAGEAHEWWYHGPKSHDSMNLNLEVRNSPNSKENKKFELDSVNVKNDFEQELHRILFLFEFEFKCELNNKLNKKNSKTKSGGFNPRRLRSRL